jgi:hypothetical protein
LAPARRRLQKASLPDYHWVFEEATRLATSRPRPFLFIAATALLLPLCAVSVLRADTVWVGADGKKALERKNMKIEGMVGGGLVFRSASADRAAEPRPLKEIWRIQVEDEKALNDAETALTQEKWDDAVAGYKRAIAATRKDWVKQFASMRMLTAAEKSGKFSAAAAAYSALVARDPKAAESVKPEIPANAKADLPAAIDAVKTALADTKLKGPQKNALQAFLAELYIANDQAKEAQALAGEAPAPPRTTASGVPAKPRGSTDDADDKAPPARTATAAPRNTRNTDAAAPSKSQVDLNLQLATASLKQKNFQDAVDKIDAIADNLNEPEQQAQALFCLAEAKAGLAGNDAGKLKDAALAYMRVVAHFRGDPAQQTHVAESLLKSGEVLERAKLLPDALAAYEAVKTDYKESPQAKDAAEGIARVQKAIEAEKS